MLIARRIAAAIAMSIAAASAATCGGSTAVETVVGPDSVRCQTTLAGEPAVVPPNGGSVTVNVTAGRDCTWTASTDASWMQLSTASGQGNGPIGVTVARNDVPAPRTGAVIVNDQRFGVAQEARPCTYELRASIDRLSSDGGRGSVAVETLSGCAWTATSSTTWLRVVTPSGSGTGMVEFEASANSGAAREASIAIGGRQVTIAQQAAADPGPAQPNCAAGLTPATISAVAAGGTYPVALAINPTCEWSASSTAAWITVAPPSGRGSATLTLTVARNTGSERSGTVTVGQQTITVNQAAAPVCTVTIDPLSLDFGAAGGEGRVRVTTQDGCDWTTSGGAAWTQVTNGRGTGSGEARYTVAANTTTSARSTTLTVGGRSHSVTQQGAAPTCTYALQPSSRTFGAAGGSGVFDVVTQAGCSWTATSGASWATLGNSSGNGPGQAAYTVQANSATSPRSTTITVNGQAHAITQEGATPACTYSLQPTSQNFGSSGGNGQFSVVTQDGCAWSASSGASWTTLGVSAGAGPGNVTYTVLANPGAARQTSITVDGQAHTVTQDAAPPPAPCTYAIDPASRDFTNAGGEGVVRVTTGASCAWTATSPVSWITVSSGGTGSGDLRYTVAPNTGGLAREATITVAGQPHLVRQQ